MNIARFVSRSLVIAVTVLYTHAAAAQVASRDLDVIAKDSAKLRATYYAAAQKGPAVLLLHQCNMDRRSWSALGNALAKAGIHSLAFDYRGYGDSPWSNDESTFPSDIDAALASLKAQPGVDVARIAVGGASCGVNNSIQLARRSGGVKALVLLSGPTTPDGLAHLRAHPEYAIFAASSSDENLAVTSLREVTGTSTNKATTMRVVEKPGHGTELFDEDPALLSAVVAWLDAILRN